MEVILSNQVESLTGSLGRGFGYSIQRQGDRFFAKRNSKGIVPPDGHWRFIVTCAELAQAKLHITDIILPGWEIFGALEEAGFDMQEFKYPISVNYGGVFVRSIAKQFQLIPLTRL